MNNTIENKAKFYGLYHGQEVRVLTHNDGRIFQWKVGMELPSLNSNFSNDYLELTPLSKITDEDAIEVARIIHKENGFHEGHWERNVENEGIMWLDNKSDDDYSIGFTNGHIECYRDNSQDFYHLIFAFDLLRSKGYALPYMGLSVETLIEYGWIKLK